MTFLRYSLERTMPDGKTFIVLQAEHSILLQRRKELKMTQQAVADKADIQLRQYQRLESGERNISSSSGRILLSVCEALKLDPYLFFGKGNDEPELKYLTLPPIEKDGLRYAIPTLAFYSLVSSIPRGMVCSDDDILSCLRKAYGSDTLEIKRDFNSATQYIEECFPYWRIVSQRGFLINSFYCSKERQKVLLEKEGVGVQKVGDNESFRVDEFEYRKYDLANIKVSVMKTMSELAGKFANVPEKEADTNE